MRKMNRNKRANIPYQNALDLFPNIIDLCDTSVILILGPKLSGKTTFLNQLKTSIQDPGIQWLDDLDRGKNNPSPILRKQLASETSSLLIATISSLESIDSALIPDIYLYRHQGFEESMIQELFERSKIQLDEKLPKTWAKELRETTEGNPHSIKALLAYPLRESRKFDRSDLRDNAYLAMGETWRLANQDEEHLKLKQTIEINLKNQKPNEAVKLLSDHRERILSLGDIYFFEDKFKLLHSYLNANEIGAGLQSLILFYRSDLIIEIVDQCIQSQKYTEEEKFFLQSFKAIALSQKMKPTQAKKLIQDLFNTKCENPVFRYQIILTYIHLFSNKRELELNPKTELLNELEKNNSIPEELIGDRNHIIGRHQFAHEAIDAPVFFQSATQIYYNQNLKIKNFISSNKQIIYYLDNTKHLNDSFKASKKKAACFNLKSKFYSLVVKECYLLNSKGDYHETYERMKKFSPDFQSGGSFDLSQLWTIYLNIHTFFKLKRFDQLLKIANYLLGNEDWKSYTLWVKYYEYMRELLELNAENSSDNEAFKKYITKLLSDDPFWHSDLAFDILGLNQYRYFDLPIEPYVSQLTKSLKNHFGSETIQSTGLLLGFNLFLGGDTKNAEDYFSRSLKLSESNNQKLFLAQSLLGLALIDYQMGRYKNSVQKIKAVEKIKADRKWHTEYHEFYFIPFLKALNTKRNESQILKELNTIPLDHPYRFFFQLCFQNIDPSEFKDLNLTTAQRNYVEKMLDVIGVDAYQKVRLSTPKKQTVIPRSELKELPKNVYDLIIDRSLGQLIVKDKRVNFEDKTLLPELLQYFLLNIGKELSKKELTNQVWKERYNPLVHDARVYTSVLRLRKALGPLKNHLVTGSGSYVLGAGLNYCLIEPVSRNEHLPRAQRWILSYAGKNGKIDRKTVEHVLKIGSTSSKKHLSTLVNSGLLVRSGAGRSTTYRNT